MSSGTRKTAEARFLAREVLPGKVDRCGMTTRDRRGYGRPPARIDSVHKERRDSGWEGAWGIMETIGSAGTARSNRAVGVPTRGSETIRVRASAGPIPVA